MRLFRSDKDPLHAHTWLHNLLSLPPPTTSPLKMSVDASSLKGRDEATQKRRYEALKGRNALILSGSMFVEFMSGGMMDQFR